MRYLSGKAGDPQVAVWGACPEPREPPGVQCEDLEDEGAGKGWGVGMSRLASKSKVTFCLS